MTKIRKETYCCPKCKQYGESKMYETINVDLDHTLKEKVMAVPLKEIGKRSYFLSFHTTFGIELSL